MSLIGPTVRHRNFPFLCFSTPVKLWSRTTFLWIFNALSLYYIFKLLCNTRGICSISVWSTAVYQEMYIIRTVPTRPLRSIEHLIKHHFATKFVCFFLFSRSLQAKDRLAQTTLLFNVFFKFCFIDLSNNSRFVMCMYREKKKIYCGY